MLSQKLHEIILYVINYTVKELFSRSFVQVSKSKFLFFFSHTVDTKRMNFSTGEYCVLNNQSQKHYMQNNWHIFFTNDQPRTDLHRIWDPICSMQSFCSSNSKMLRLQKKKISKNLFSNLRPFFTESLKYKKGQKSVSPPI